MISMFESTVVRESVLVSDTVFVVRFVRVAGSARVPFLVPETVNVPEFQFAFISMLAFLA